MKTLSFMQLEGIHGAILQPGADGVNTPLQYQGRTKLGHERFTYERLVTKTNFFTGNVSTYTLEKEILIDPIDGCTDEEFQAHLALYSSVFICSAVGAFCFRKLIIAL